MPHEHLPDYDCSVAEHLILTRNERRLLREIARGATDREISVATGQTEVSVRSGLRRFRDRTGLAGRRLVVWAVEHSPCCVMRVQATSDGPAKSRSTLLAIRN